MTVGDGYMTTCRPARLPALSQSYCRSKTTEWDMTICGLICDKLLTNHSTEYIKSKQSPNKIALLFGAAACMCKK